MVAVLSLVSRLRWDFLGAKTSSDSSCSVLGALASGPNESRREELFLGFEDSPGRLTMGSESKSADQHLLSGLVRTNIGD